MRSVDREAAGDAVGEVSRERVAKIVGERTLSARVVRHGDDREQIGPERLEGDARMAGRAVAVGLIQIPDLSDEIGLGVGDKVLHREATFATGHDVRASARKRRLRDDLRLGVWPDLGAEPGRPSSILLSLLAAPRKPPACSISASLR